MAPHPTRHLVDAAVHMTDVTKQLHREVVAKMLALVWSLTGLKLFALKRFGSRTWRAPA